MDIYSKPFHMGFNTVLFRRPAKSWSTHQLRNTPQTLQLCREPEKCPLKGECLVKEVVYQVTITTAESTETYVGLTATEFKTRWRNHQMSFKHENRKNDTELSKHLWQLKDQKKDFTISWKIPSQGQILYQSYQTM